MRRVFQLATAICAVAAFAPQAQATDCGLKQLASLEMIKTPRDGVVVPLTVNGTPENFLVDTGGVRSGVFSDTGAALGLKPLEKLPPGAAEYDSGGTRLDTIARVAELGIGDLKGSNLPLVWTPRQGENAEIAGILAPDILRNSDIDFDFAAGTMKLFSHEHCEGHVVYWTNSFDVISVLVNGDGHLETSVSLDGETVRAIVDTGAERTALSESVAKSRFNIDPDSENADSGFRSDRFHSLTLGAIAVSNPLVWLLPDAAKHSAKIDEWKVGGLPFYQLEMENPQLLVGMDVLRKLHLYIAYHESKLYLTAAEAGLPAESAR